MWDVLDLVGSTGLRLIYDLCVALIMIPYGSNNWVLLVGGPTQHFWRKNLVSTLHTFILGSRNSDIGPTAKSHISLIIQNPPSNPMASILSL